MKFTDFIQKKEAIVSFDDRQHITFEEKGRKYIGDNSKRKVILRLRIDKKLVDESSKKCDFAAIIPPNDIVYFDKTEIRKSNAILKNKKTFKDMEREFSDDEIIKIYSDSICFLIETKGKDISTAVKQIDKTISLMKDIFGIKKVVGRIVASECKTQELNTVEYNSLLRKLAEIKAKYDIPYIPLIQKTKLLDNDKL